MQNLSELITGVTVVYNTKELIERAYNSIRSFHPDMIIILVDGSSRNNPCSRYLGSIRSIHNHVIRVGYNIGHGRGMNLGIGHVNTPYAMVFDSDIEMLKSPVREMLDMFEEDTFGVGYIEKTGFDGFEYGSRAQHVGQDWMPYLHPYFQLISIASYRKFHPYVHHGAPCYLTMLDIYKKGLSGKIIKEFPGLGHSAGGGWNWSGSPKEFIRHDTTGTRQMRKKSGMREIEGKWDLNRGLV